MKPFLYYKIITLVILSCHHNHPNFKSQYHLEHPIQILSSLDRRDKSMLSSISCQYSVRSLYHSSCDGPNVWNNKVVPASGFPYGIALVLGSKTLGSSQSHFKDDQTIYETLAYACRYSWGIRWQHFCRNH